MIYVFDIRSLSKLKQFYPNSSDPDQYLRSADVLDSFDIDELFCGLLER